MRINIKTINGGKIPTYKTLGAAGADCYARIEGKEIVVRAKEIATIPLGFAVEIPMGYEMQIRPRSGLAKQNGVVNILGTIDSDYRGEVAAILENKSDEDFIVRNDDRIAQAVIAPVVRGDFVEVLYLSETKRGNNGFGSTGV